MDRFLAGVGASLMLGGLACAAPAPVSVGRSAVESAAPATSAPAGPPQVLLDENFARTWPDNPRGSAWFAEGGYRLWARSIGEFVAVRAPLAEVPADVIVSGTFRKVGGPPDGGYGLILADQGIGAGDGVDQSGQFIVAEVGDLGKFGIWRRDGERWIDLVPWTLSSAVHTDTGANDLSVQFMGGRLTFVVNGAQVADLPNVDRVGPRPGRVGVFTGGDFNEVVVNRFRVQALGRVADPRAAAAAGQVPAPGPTPHSRAAAQPAAVPRPPADPTGSQSGTIDPERFRNLLVGIAEDVAAIAASFAGGLDNPRDPVNDPRTLRDDAARLASATGKANELRAELDRIKSEVPGGR